jgi:hypothetical protein
MVAALRQALDKMRHDGTSLRSARIAWRGSHPLFHLPRGDAAPAVATCYIINAVSLLDEGLTMYLSSRQLSGAQGAGTLAKRIAVLRKAGRLNNAARLNAIRKRRNAYAHEPGKYGDWAEFDATLREVEQTFRQLGLI